jgi:hypothetical protein
MFRELIDDVKAAAGSLIAKYFARGSVAVPFIVALAFATTALTITLVERYGQVVAYWLLAAGFALVGVLAALVVGLKEQETELIERQAEERGTVEAVTSAATQLPVAALGTLFSSPGGATAALAVAKLLGRNLPLVVLALLIGMLLLPDATDSQQQDADGETRNPNGMHPPSGVEPIGEAA